MFWRKTYSDKALQLSAAALEVVDAKIENDLANYGPREVPLEREWHFNGFWDVLLSSKSLQAEKRTSFNIGLMNGLASIFFDGEAKDFDNFVKESIKIGVAGGNTLLNYVGEVEKKHPKLFSLGASYSKDFFSRHLSDSHQKADADHHGEGIKSQRSAKDLDDDEQYSPYTFAASLAVNISEITRLLGVDTRFSNAHFLSHFFDEQQALRYNAYKSWAAGENAEKESTSEASEIFRKNNVILDQSASYDLFKPIEYSFDEAIFEKSAAEQEEYFETREALYAKVNPSIWYASVARHYISRVVDFLKQLQLFLLQFSGNNSAFKINIYVVQSGSEQRNKVVSIDKLIEKVNDYLFSGEFEIEITTLCDFMGSITICGWIRREFVQRDSYGGLYPPAALCSYGFGGEKPSPSFYTFVCDLDPTLRKFLPKVSTEFIYDDAPYFLEFAIKFESMVFAVNNRSIEQDGVLKNNFSGLGELRAREYFFAEIFNSNPNFYIFRVKIVLTGEFRDGHKFSEYVLSESQWPYSDQKKVFRFCLNNPRASEGYTVKSWTVVEVQLSKKSSDGLFD